MRIIRTLALLAALGLAVPALCWAQADTGRRPQDRGPGDAGGSPNVERPMKRNLPPEARELAERQRGEMQALRERYRREMEALQEKHRQERQALRQKLMGERKDVGGAGGPGSSGGPSGPSGPAGRGGPQGRGKTPQQ